MRNTDKFKVNNLSEIFLEFDSNSILNLMLGEQSLYFNKLQNILDVELHIFGNRLRIYGYENDVIFAKMLFVNVYNSIVKNEIDFSNYNFSLFETEIRMLKQQSFDEKQNSKTHVIKTWKKTVVPKSSGQNNYLQALNDYDLVFGLGPAGTGKSFLAVAKGIELLKKGEVDKIILSRPAVEAGENLGFLPGDMKEKVDPYLRPIYDALYEMIPFDRVERKIQNGEIEIAPLAFMRGRTFQNAYIIIDEAQNTTSVQMKMILTRLGTGSKMVVNGDLSQIDIPHGVQSGLAVAVNKLIKVQNIKAVHLSNKDVFRHTLVAEIIKAYDNE